jgi:hypothetical protein
MSDIKICDDACVFQHAFSFALRDGGFESRLKSGLPDTIATVAPCLRNRNGATAIERYVLYGLS